MDNYINHKSTLEYCDGPIVIEALDRIGGNYIGIALESENQAFRFLVLGVTPLQASQVRCGDKDLRGVVVSSARHGWYLCETDDLDEPIKIEGREGQIPPWMLPDEGYYLAEPSDIDNRAMVEARDRLNFAIHVKMDPKNENRMHRMKLKDYTEVILGLHSLIRSAGDNIFSGNEEFNKSQLDLDIVTPAASGSLEVVLEASNHDNDLFNRHPAFVQSLCQIDDALKRATDVDQLKQLSVENGSKFARLLVKLLDSLDRGNMDFRYSWAEPVSQIGNVTSLRSAFARDLVQSIKSKSHEILHTSSREVRGRFTSFNRKQGTWGLETEDESVKGVVDKDDRPEKLDGLVVDKTYVFRCKEITTFAQALKQTPPTLTLQQILETH